MSRIGFDARLPAYHQGGIATWIREVLNALQSQDTTHQLTVLESRKARFSLAGRFDRSTLYTPCHHVLEKYALSIELLPKGLDLLHSPDFIPPLRGARRHVITIHDLHFLHFPQYMTRDSRRYYSGQLGRAARQADHILTVSRAAKRDIIELLQVPAERITALHHGVNGQFRPLSADALEKQRRKLELPKDFFLFVGTFEPRKNLITLIEAWSLLKEQLPDAPPVVLAGRKGWLFDETLRGIRDLQVADDIIWREDVGQESLPALYGLASALVLPSLYEGFGLPALEAMACGTLPIVSNVSSLPEVVGDVGIQIDPNDSQALAAAMLRSLGDSDWRTGQEAAGLKRAANFSWERHVKALLQVWDQVLNDA
ncbi:MAG: glycosyltransferase family 1 protein [Anaerolineaceae bacterium]|nr:glycosyltransferase family 1 protein [Anaerolineaceae bacterium]